jgi:hypothetical protein
MEHLREAARHLREATKLASDWRVKEAAAGAGTGVNCAIYIEERIEAGTAELERERPEPQPKIEDRR